MPHDQADGDPADINGIPLKPEEINQSGDDKGNASIAESLGVDPDELDDDDTTEDEDDDDDADEGDDISSEQKNKSKDDKSKDGSKGNQSKDDPNELGKNYETFVQKNAEEAYAIAFNRAKNDSSYLDSLVKSDDPVDQRIAQKLLERNDFGAKTIKEYRANIRKQEIGDDPTKLKIAELEDEVHDMKASKAKESWDNWKRENEVKGKAAELADDIHARYPDMAGGEVMEMVKGKLGTEYRAPQKRDNSSTLYGGDVSPQGDDLPSTNSSLSKALLPNAKKTKKFAKQYLRDLRR